MAISFQLIFSRFYKGNSALDRTSLFALRNLVNWRDAVSDSHARPAQCKRFAYLVLDADIIAAAHHFFGMNTNDDFPTQNGFDNNLAKRSVGERLRFLNDVVKRFLCKYISDPNSHATYLHNINLIQKWESQRNNQDRTPDGRYRCRFEGCDRSYQYDGVSRRRHEMSHDPPPKVLYSPVLLSTDQPTGGAQLIDDVHNYHCNFMNMTLLLRNFNDACHEGDGERIVRCIKFFLLYFFEDGTGSSKYCLEALHLMFQIHATLTPRDAQRTIWNRTVNNRGGLGNNVPLDLDLEHDNHLLKDMVRGLGSNISSITVTRISKAFFVLKDLCKKLDQELDIREVSGEHTRKDINKDLYQIVQVLKEERVFSDVQLSREMRSLPNFPSNYLQDLDTVSLFKWINSHKKNVLSGVRPR